ncbi:hypothetical protein KBC70_04710 [Candidatus Woesebacteria bacterium]|nr:hypothetical protein [Candidatus Woesebacteria bacterium]
MSKTMRFLTLVLLVFFTAGCRAAQVSTMDQSASTMKLLDVTSSAGMSGKYAVRRASQSFWQNGSEIVRCLHRQDPWSGPTQGGTSCEEFNHPAAVPSEYILLAMNMGTGQKTQSIWGRDGHYFMCDHQISFWEENIKEEAKCREWFAPVEVGDARLVSINSGQSQETESFWSQVDGAILKCEHDKMRTGFIGLGGMAIGNVRSCGVMQTPTFPDGYRPILMGATSDRRRPAETFWQAESGVLFRCIHEKVNDGVILFGYDHFGRTEKCEYWRAP